MPCFQREVNQIISKLNCKGTFVYLDDITVCGHNREEHDKNLKAFLKAAEECNLNLRVYATNTNKLFGYLISDGSWQPDQDAPILNLPVPTTPKELQRIVGMFFYYAQWSPKFSEKNKPLINATAFRLPNEALLALKMLKHDLATATLNVIID